MTQETFPMIVGGEETLNERTLLTQVESGLMMNGADSVRFIVIHCSATQSDRDYTVEQLHRDHKVRGFRTMAIILYPQEWNRDTASPTAGSRCPCPWTQSLQHRYLL